MLTTANGPATGGRTYRIVAVEGLDGAGKSSLVHGMRERSPDPARVGIGRVGRAVTGAFRELIERDDDTVLYQDVLPPAFRMQAYLFDAATQFTYLHEQYSAYDVVLFDRWMHTAEVYCAPVDEHVELFAQLRRHIPVPDAVVYLRVDPELACERLRQRGDRWCKIYSQTQLRDKMTRLHDGYEALFADSPDVWVVDGAQPRDRVLAAAMAVLT